MPIFELEYPDRPEKLLTIIAGWESSDEYKKLCTGRDYFNCENTTIAAVRKVYFSDARPVLDKYGVPTLNTDGTPKMAGGGFVNNPYVANNKIGFGIFRDIVSQKVNTLLDEMPQIETKSKMAPGFIRNLGYGLKVAGNKASAQGYSYIYLQRDGGVTVFKTENCIPYFSEYSGELVALVRYWSIATATAEYKYIETYAADGVTTYRTNPARPGKLEIYRATEPYKYSTVRNVVENRVAPDIMPLPIIILRNNEDMQSDLTTSVRAKIDAIDIVNSGFMNNIEDFSELFWVVKNNSGMDATAFNDFVANVNRTKKVILSGDGDIDTKQITIPTEARAKFVELMKSEIIFETGVLDNQTLTGSSLTNVAIKAATLKLRQRVSEFEWYVYQAGRRAVEIYQGYTGIVGEFDIEFTQMLIDNEREIIENANMCRPDISLESYLEQISRAGIIRDVKTEMERLAAEDATRYRMEPEATEPEVNV